MIATIAFIFHWPLSELDRMPLEEVARWHDLAVERWNHAHRPPKES